jgi:dynein heavy chain
MEDSAADFQGRYDNFGKEVKEWGAFTYIKSEIDKFRNTLPLLGELRNDAMRDRHWKALRVEVKDDFDETSDEFNLEKVFSLNLFAH